MEKKSVKETLEALAALELLSVTAVGILKDGLAADDLPKVLELIKQHQVLIDGFGKMGDIPEEVKDVDQEELIAVGLKVFGTIKSIKEAAKK